MLRYTKNDKIKKPQIKIINSKDGINLDQLINYYKTCYDSGFVLRQGLQNPSMSEIKWFNSRFYRDFNLSKEYVNDTFKHLIRNKNDNRIYSTCANLVYTQLTSLKLNNERDTIIKNIFTKFVCWIHFSFFDFEHFGDVLVEGSITGHLQMFYKILNDLGMNVIILNCKNKDLTIDLIEKNLTYGSHDVMRSRLCVRQNVWLPSVDVLNHATHFERNFANNFDTIYCRMNGTDDANIYPSDLFNFYNNLKNGKVIVNGKIPAPLNNEVSKIKRINCTTFENTIINLSNNFLTIKNDRLRDDLRELFIFFCGINFRQVDERGVKRSVQSLLNDCIIVICWIFRYLSYLNLETSIETLCIPTFIFYGNPTTKTEITFLEIIGRLPIDVIIFNHANEKDLYEDSIILDCNFSNKSDLNAFPKDKLITVASSAETQIDKILYSNTDYDKISLYSKFNVITLDTIFEEIAIMLKENVNIRPGFRITKSLVTVPVIFAKVNGIPNGDLKKYWSFVNSLINESTIFIHTNPYFSSEKATYTESEAFKFFIKGNFSSKLFLEDKKNPFKILNHLKQNIVADAIKKVIGDKVINGIKEFGIEYKIVSCISCATEMIMRMLQSFDTTNQNPRVVWLNVGNSKLSLNDSIMFAFLHYVGFDIIFLTPTGYRVIDDYYANFNPVIHDLGNYKFNLDIPKKLLQGNKKRFRFLSL